MGSPRIRLPGALTDVAFTVARARSLGVGDGRLRGSDLERPFRGVRVSGLDLTDVGERCRALATVLARWCVFSHETAARLWRMPLPAEAGGGARLDVLSLGGRDAMRMKGVSGRSTAIGLDVTKTARVPVAAAADVWCQLAGLRSGIYTREWLVAIGDFLVSGERTDYGRRPPLCSLDDLSLAVARHGPKRGAADLRWALTRIRRPVDSPRETFLRLALVADGLPEPAVQPTIRTAAGDRHPDLGYRAERLLLEYLGDGHRQSAARWRDDLTRVQLFEDAGWRVMLIGYGDVEPDPGALVERVRRALADPRVR